VEGIISAAFVGVNLETANRGGRVFAACATIEVPVGVAFSDYSHAENTAGSRLLTATSRSAEMNAYLRT